MNPIRPIAQAVRNYFNFRGRASRSEFWWLFVVVLLLEALFIVWQQEKFPLLILWILEVAAQIFNSSTAGPSGPPAHSYCEALARH